MEVAQRLNWEVVHVFEDQASGAKGRDQRPGFDGLMKAITADSDDAAMLFRDHAAGHSDLIPPPPGRLLTVLICGVFGPSVKPVGWI